MVEHINSIFYFVIVAVAFIIGIVETVSIANYQRKDCYAAKKAIEVLQQYPGGYIKASDVNKRTIRWLIQYLKGESTQSAFKPEQNKNGDFILLSYPSILGKPVPRSPVSFAPALLTAIGILGTFSGIFLGLRGVDLENISESEQLIEASQKLLVGMKTSFSTSLFGLGAAITFIIILALGANKRTAIRNSLRKKLSDIAFLENPNRLLSRLDNDSDVEAAKTLQAIVDAVKSAIAPDSPLVLELKQIIDNTSSLSNLTPKAIASATSDNFTVLINPLAQEIKQLRELQQSQGQTVESLVRQLRNELIEPVVARLDQSAAITKEASAAVTDLKNELGGISTSLAGAVETIQSFQQDTLTRLREFAANLQSILGQFRTDTQGVMEQVAVEIQEAVNHSITGMEAQRTAFDNSASQASQTFRGIRQDLQAALSTQAEQQKEMLRDVQTSTEGILVKANEAFVNQSNTLITVGEEASGLMNEAQNNFQGMMKDISVEIQQAVNHSITGMEAQRTAFDNSASQASQTFRGIRQDLQAALSTQAEQQKEMLRDVQTSTEGILVKANEAFVNQSNTLITVGEEASGLMNEAQNNFQGMMKDISVEIQQAVNHSITGMEAQRTAFDNSASQASQTFRGIRQDLQAALSTQAEQQKEMLRDVQTSTEGILVKANEAFVNQSNTLITVGEEASGLMNEAKDSFIGTLGDLDGMLQKTSLTVQQELEQFRLDYQTALQDFFTQQNNLLNDTLGKQREGLAGVVVSLQQTFNEEATQRKEMTAQVDRSLDRIGETVKTVNNLASAMGMTSSERLGQLQELARTIGSEAHRVERSYQSMTEQFNEALDSGNEKLNDYLKQADETYTRSIQDADRAAAEVCTKLNETSHGLMSVAEFLVAAATEMKNSNK